MDADDILDTMAMLRCNLHPSEALLVPPPPSQVQDEDIQVRSRKQSSPLLTGVTSSSSSLFGFDEEDVFHAHNAHTAVTSLRADCTTSNSSSSSAAAAEDYYDQDQDDGDDPNHGRGTNFLSAALARDRMRGLESQIERTTSSALPTPMVVEFLWLKHRAEENPQLDTLGPKGVGHGGVAAMPRSLYTAVMIIPLIVTGLVGPQTEEDVETGIVSRRRVPETLFCLGDVDLPRGPQRSCLSSFVACSAVMGIRCYDGIYAWVVSGAPWYLFHFSSLAAQVIFIWYIRTADIEQQQQQQQEGGGGGGAIGLQSDGSLFADAGDSIINSSANATIELSTACAASRPLRFVAAGVYSGMLFKEICETFSMAAWLYRAPASSVTEPIQVSRASPSTASVDLISGFSAWYKCWCIFIAVIPKLALAAALWFYGGAFILRAVNDSELILNTVAVTFVNEIDDLLYTVLVPPDIDRLLADLPELDWMPPAKPGQKGSTLRRWSIALNTFAGQYLYAGIILAMTYGALEVACQ